MATETTAPIDIMSEALKINGGKPVEAQLYGLTFSVKRDYTADQVHQYIALFTDEGRPETNRDQVIEQLKAMTDLSTDNVELIADELMKLPIVEVTSVLVKIGQIAGLRGADTGFLTGIGSF